MSRSRWLVRSLSIVVVACCVLPVLADVDTTAIERLVSGFAEEHRFSGSVLVARGDEVLYEGGFGEAERSFHVPNGPDTVFLVGSVSKQFTSMLILQMVQEGKIELDAPVGRYLPDFPEDKGQVITIHQLLCHISGLPHYAGFARLDVDLGDYMRLERPISDYVELIGKLELESEPGTNHAYSSMGYIVLGLVAEKVSGKTFSQLIQQRIAGPLGVHDLGFAYNDRLVERLARGYVYGIQELDDGSIELAYVPEPYRDQSNKYCTGGVHASVRALFTWARALFTDKLLSEKYRDLMFTRQAENYGYGWSIRSGDDLGLDEEIEVIGHGGSLSGYKASIMMLERGKYTIISLGNSSTSRSASVTEGIARLLYGVEPDPANILGTAVAWRMAQDGVEVGRTFFARQEARGFPDYLNNDFAFAVYAENFAGEYDRPELAQAMIDLGLAAHPDSAMLYLALAELKNGLGKPDAARAAAEKTLALVEEAGEDPVNAGPRARALLEELEPAAATSATTP